MKKRFLTILLSLCMTIGMLPVEVFAIEENVSDVEEPPYRVEEVAVESEPSADAGESASVDIPSRPSENKIQKLYPQKEDEPAALQESLGTYGDGNSSFTHSENEQDPADCPHSYKTSYVYICNGYEYPSDEAANADEATSKDPGPLAEKYDDYIYEKLVCELCGDVRYDYTGYQQLNPRFEQQVYHVSALDSLMVAVVCDDPTIPIKVSYKSKNPELVEVDSETGAVTILGYTWGYVTLEATIEAPFPYEPVTVVSCSLTIEKVNPYVIHTAEDLVKFRTLCLSGLCDNAQLAEDIDFTDQELCVEWEPISSYTSYTGSFDGNGHTISNLKIKTPDAPNPKDSTYYVGLFGELNGGKVENLTLDNLNITIGTTDSPVESCKLNVGGIAGFVRKGSISNCTVRGEMTITSSQSLEQRVALCAGGLAGSTTQSIADSVNEMQIEVTGTSAGYVGGITGKADSDAELTGCENRGYIKVDTTANWSNTYAGSSYIGGIAGYAAVKTTTGCANSGTISVHSRGLVYVGGVAGYYMGSLMSGCRNSAMILVDSQAGADVGGIGGLCQTDETSYCFNSGRIQLSLMDDAVTTTSSAFNTFMAGGIWGNSISSNIVIHQSANTGDISVNVNHSNKRGSEAFAGGILGCDRNHNSNAVTQINDCYNLGDVTASSANNSPYAYAGGIVGKLEGSSATVNHTYNKGDVTADALEKPNGSTAGNTTYIYATAYAGGIWGVCGARNLTATGNLLLRGQVKADAVSESDKNKVDSNFLPIGYYLLGEGKDVSLSLFCMDTTNFVMGDGQAEAVLRESSTKLRSIYTERQWDLDTIWLLEDGAHPILRGQPEGFYDGVREISPVSITYYDGREITVDLEFGDELFYLPSSIASRDLALLAAVLSSAAYDNMDKYPSSGRYIYNAYQSLGFEKKNITLYSYLRDIHGVNDFDFDDSRDMCFSIASKKLELGDTLMLVSLRGSVSIYDWASDFNTLVTEPALGVETHPGFKEYADKVVRGIDKYMTQHDLFETAKAGKLKILVTGHSLGGGGSNLVGALLNCSPEKYGPHDNIFVYTFATPNTYHEEYKGYTDNIFNICAPGDPVTWVPNDIIEDINDIVKGGAIGIIKTLLRSDWRDFGRTNRGIFNSNLPSFDNHKVSNYVDAVKHSSAADYLESFGKWAYVRCPVDVRVEDAQGNVLCSITDNVVDENSTLMALVDGDEKLIYLPDDGREYQIYLTGTDAGTMECGLLEWCITTSERGEMQGFENVKLESGKKMLLTETEEEETTTCTLVVLGANDTPVKSIAPDGTETPIAVDPDAGHKLTEVSGVAATCKDAGIKIHWHCSVCNKNFADAAGTTELSDVTTPIDATNHVGGTENRNAKDATYEETGYTGDTYCLGCGAKIADGTVIPKKTQSSGGGGGGISGYSYYTIKATAGPGGSISPSGNVSVREGRDQTFTFTPDKGYAISNVKIDGKSIGAAKSYTFENARRTHTIEVIFMKANGNPQTGVFVDVATGSYYEDAVDWAVENGITKGSDDTHFSPDGICTRAQAVTFLWRAAGSPVVNYAMNFSDVSADAYYSEAVRWAVSQGITKGTSDTTFSPNMTCTRAQIVTFLWRSEKSPAAGTANPFADVKSTAYYTDAVLWAVEENITKGTTNTTFSPDADCTRAQIVTFLWRCKK